MRKSAFFLAFMLLTSFGFAQENLPRDPKPFNKGNVKMDIGYSWMMRNRLTIGYPEFRIGVGYGVTNWCVVGVFGSFGTKTEQLTITGEYDTISNTSINHFEGQWTEHFFRYGITAEFHPLSIFLPHYYIFDVYCRGELGMRTVTDHYEPEFDNPYSKPVHSGFLYGASIGLAINPSKYCGVFYELCYDNFNHEYANIQTGETKPKPFHRFGLNVRFPGPKKWQK